VWDLGQVQIWCWLDTWAFLIFVCILLYNSIILLAKPTLYLIVMMLFVVMTICIRCRLFDIIGHLKYYEESGVVRDMLQSHAMTLFALVGCSLPASSAHIQQILASRQQLLAAVSVVQPQHILLGQYSTFAAEVLEQLQHLVQATVPTFAAAVLSVNTNRWQGVPFVLVSGKKLDKKASYVRVVFRKNLLCISRIKCTDGGEVVFNVGGINSPSIVISKTLGQPVVPSGWKISLEAEDEDNIVLKPIHDVEAYTALLEAVFDGQRHLFADMTSVLASWRIWSDVVSDGTLPYRNYTGGKDGCNMLDFHINGNRPEFLFPLMPEDRLTADIKQLPSEFRSQKLVTGNTLAVKQSVVSWLVSLMQEAVQLRGVCHIALSGGQTIVQVVQLLAEDYSVPWAKVHVWQVDERCVQANDSERNVHILQPLVHVALLPLASLHAMPVHLAGSPCALDDHADAVYEADMKRHIPDGILDIAVLGVGEDGHTASLFPNSEALSVTDRWVAFADSESARTKKRLTLTFPTLNRARHLPVIITGAKKRSIVERISTVTDHQAYPITGLNGDDVRWYIDNAALAV
jgi:hexose-6-phosphate dehydrogenase